LFGVETLSGVLAGALVSGVQIAISASNTGGAWDNAKKYIEVKSHRIQRTISSVQICILPYVKKTLLKEVPLLKE